jgi:hypothetical protein
MLSCLTSFVEPGLKLSICRVHHQESSVGLGCTFNPISHFYGFADFSYYPISCLEQNPCAQGHRGPQYSY